MSFNNIADTPGIQVSLAKFDSVEIKVESMRVRVGAGVKFGILADRLDSEGFALETIPSWAKTNVVGSIVTGSHANSYVKKAFSSQVEAIEYIDYTGQLKVKVKGEKVKGEIDFE
jgi:alditol oxidase